MSYMIDRAAKAVETTIGCCFLSLPEVKVTNKMPKGKLGYCCDTHIAIRPGMPNYQVERALCHELIHWAGVDCEEQTDDLEISAWVRMEPRQREKRSN